MSGFKKEVKDSVVRGVVELTNLFAIIMHAHKEASSPICSTSKMVFAGLICVCTLMFISFIVIDVIKGQKTRYAIIGYLVLNIAYITYLSCKYLI